MKLQLTQQIITLLDSFYTKRKIKLIKEIIRIGSKFRKC